MLKIIHGHLLKQSLSIKLQVKYLSRKQACMAKKYKQTKNPQCLQVKIFLNRYLYTKLNLKKNLMSHESTGKYKKDKTNKK